MQVISNIIFVFFFNYKTISGGKFTQKYHLPSTSSVVSGVKGLLEKDFITQTDNTYYVYDRFFQLWLEKK